MPLQLSIIQNKINTIIDEYTTNIGVESIHYVAYPAGKCLRAYLFIKCAEMLNVVDNNILHIAAAIELIHSFSLVHDDLPALDNDEMRRGKPSCHVIFAEAQAILTGNALLMLAFEIIGKYAPSLTFSASRLVNLMIRGQMHDIKWKNNYCNNVEEVIGMYKLKTGAMFALAARFAGELAASPTSRLLSLENYGYNLGIAFQIKDDLSETSEVNLNYIISKEKMKELIKQRIDMAKQDLQAFESHVLEEFADYILHS